MRVRKMRVLLAVTAVLAMIFAAAPQVRGHGDKVHVIGVIEKVDAHSVTVKTKEGKSVEVKLAETTTYATADGKAVKMPQLTVGQRVVIHADQKGADLIAATVKFAGDGGGAAASPKS